MLHFHFENRYSSVQIFEKYDSRVFKSGDIVHFLRQTYRKVNPCHGILAHLRNGAWDRIWRERPIFGVKMTRAGLHQLDFTKHLLPIAPAVEKFGVRKYTSQTSKSKIMYLFNSFTHLCPNVLKNWALICQKKQNAAFSL